MSVTEKYWDDAREGDECISPSYTVTRERILAYADLTGDHTPVHVDEAYANASHFGCLVAHGLFGLSIADGLKTQCDYRFVPGMSLGWTWDFVLPIKVDDVLHVRMRVGAMRLSKSRRVGHRGPAVGADQPARPGRATRRAPADGAVQGAA